MAICLKCQLKGRNVSPKGRILSPLRDNS
jgi:hypothetical protein